MEIKIKPKKSNIKTTKKEEIKPTDANGRFGKYKNRFRRHRRRR